MINVAAPITDADEIRKAIKVPTGTRITESLTLFCTKCKRRTAGVYLNPKNRHRNCPACNSILLYCPVCHSTTSGTEKFKMLSCDDCKTDFVTDDTIADIASRDHQAQEIVLSGIRATGRLHLGNFLGAVKQFVDYESGSNLCMYFIADWHTLTTLRHSDEIVNNVVDIATDYLAAGLNPDKSIIYAQSSVPEIAELAMYLSMIQSKNQLEDLPTLKDLLKQKNEVGALVGVAMTLGHLSYPVLMAADILGMKATLVPVGADQISNVELARDLARKFNNMFGSVFTIPNYSERHIKVPGLGGGKMGKSEQEGSVNMHDDLASIRTKYKKGAVTDANKVRANDVGNPQNCMSVFPMYDILLENDRGRVESIASECRSGARGCSTCKDELSIEIEKIIKPFRDRRAELDQKPEYIREVLHFGGMRAREIIQPTLVAVREKMGIRSF